MRYPYAEILGRPSVPRLLVAAVVGRMPIGMGALALFLLVRGAGGSYAAAGLAVSASTVAGCVGAPVLGRLVDRHGQPRVLVASMGSQVAALLVLAALAPAGGPLLYALCAVYGFSNPPLAAALRATWTTLLDERGLLTRAFSLDSTAQEAIWILGPLLSATLAAGVGTRAPLVAMACFSAAGVTWFATSDVSRAWRPQRDVERHLLGPLTAAPVRRVLLCILGLAFAWGSLELAIPAYAQEHGESPGLLLSVWAVGSVIGGLLYAARAWNRTPQRMMAILLVLNLAGLAILLVARTPIELGLLLVVNGLVNAPVIATFYVLIEELAPTGTTTEAFTWISTTFLVGISGGVASAGVVADVAEPTTAFWLGVAGCAFAAACALVRQRGLHAVESVADAP